MMLGYFEKKVHEIEKSCDVNVPEHCTLNAVIKRCLEWE
jgi:hypothetical protein